MDDDPSPRLRALTGARVALDLVGARIALRHGLVGEPLRIRLPDRVPTPVVLVGWGTALSAPWAMTAAHLALAAGPDAERTRAGTRALAWLGLAGVLSEPATWGRRRPRGAMLLSAAHLAVTLGFLHATRRDRT